MNDDGPDGRRRRRRTVRGRMWSGPTFTFFIIIFFFSSCPPPLPVLLPSPLRLNAQINLSSPARPTPGPPLRSAGPEAENRILFITNTSVDNGTRRRCVRACEKETDS